jgi:hypothetical protein
VVAFRARESATAGLAMTFASHAAPANVTVKTMNRTVRELK